MVTEIETLWLEFAARRSLGEIPPDISGRYLLVLDDALRIAIFQSGPSLYLDATLGTLPPANSIPDPLIDLLRVSLAGFTHHDEVLALDPDGDTLRLYRRLSVASLTLDSFELALESLANRLEHWSRVLSQASISRNSSPISMQILFP